MDDPSLAMAALEVRPFFCYNAGMQSEDIKQDLPTYKKDFEAAPWLRKKTDHYELSYFAGSFAEKDIDSIAARQEEAFIKIINFLEVPAPERKIRYFLYPDAGIKKVLMGDDWFAQSIYKDFCIHMLYTEKIKPIGEHEDTHLLSLSWGLSIGFFQEGLAEYTVGHNWYGDSHDSSVRQGFKKNIVPALHSMMDHAGWSGLGDDFAVYYYSFAGSFVAFLITAFGKEKFKELYIHTDRSFSKDKNESIFSAIYHLSISETEGMWKANIGA
jgi:hypothetical protein